MTFANETKYIGQFKEGKYEGYGELQGLVNNYKGKWKSGVREGKGIMLLHDGTRYEGDFVNN